MTPSLEATDPSALAAVVAGWAAGLCIVRLLWMACRAEARVRRRPRPHRSPLRLLPLLGGGLALAPLMAHVPTVRSLAAEQRPGSRGSTWAPPWVGSDGSPPPRPFERTRGEPSPHHPGAQGLVPGPREANTYTVRQGDTLWDIAARSLRTDDARLIDRGWPAIHVGNRRTIGPDPDLIFPGQVLVLPPEVRR